MKVCGENPGKIQPRVFSGHIFSRRAASGKVKQGRQEIKDRKNPQKFSPKNFQKESPYEDFSGHLRSMRKGAVAGGSSHRK